MKVNIEYKGKQVEIEIPDEKLEELVAEKKRTGYERAREGEKYYSVNTGERVFPNTDMGGAADNMFYNKAAYYTDERIARDNARADTLARRLRRYAAEHGGIPSAEDWKDSTKVKYCIRCNISECGGEGTPYVKECGGARDVFQVYFSKKECCQDAMRAYRDELLWYFTEYDPQLR